MCVKKGLGHDIQRQVELFLGLVSLHSLAPEEATTMREVTRLTVKKNLDECVKLHIMGFLAPPSLLKQHRVYIAAPRMPVSESEKPDEVDGAKPPTPARAGG